MNAERETNSKDLRLVNFTLGTDQKVVNSLNGDASIYKTEIIKVPVIEPAI